MAPRILGLQQSRILFKQSLEFGQIALADRLKGGFFLGRKKLSAQQKQEEI